MKNFFLTAALSFVATMPVMAYDVLYVNGSEGQSFNGHASPGWTIVNPVEVPVGTDGKFVITVDNFNGLGISTAKGADESDWGTWNSHMVGLTRTEKITVCKPFTPALNQSADLNKDNAGGMLGGNYTLVIAGDLSEMTVYPGQIYIAGSSTTKVDGTPLAWEIVNPTTVKLNNDRFEFEVDFSDGLNIDVSVFKDPSTGNWNLWWNPGKFSARINQTDLGNPVALANSTDGLWFPETGVYTVSIPVDMSTVTASKKISTAVEDIAVEDDSEEIWYNLQGVRVDNPERGIYIVRKGGVTSKRIFR